MYIIVFVCSIVCYYMFTRLDYSCAIEYSIIRRYTNIVYYYYYLGHQRHRANQCSTRHQNTIRIIVFIGISSPIIAQGCDQQMQGFLNCRIAVVLCVGVLVTLRESATRIEKVDLPHSPTREWTSMEEEENLECNIETQVQKLSRAAVSMKPANPRYVYYGGNVLGSRGKVIKGAVTIVRNGTPEYCCTQ